MPGPIFPSEQLTGPSLGVSSLFPSEVMAMPPQIVSPNEITVGRPVHGALADSFLYTNASGLLTSYTSINFSNGMAVTGISTFNGLIDINSGILLTNGIGTTGYVLTAQGPNPPIWSQITGGNSNGINTVNITPLAAEANPYYFTNTSAGGIATARLEWESQSAGSFFASDSAIGGVPYFRNINSDDLPPSGVTGGTYSTPQTIAVDSHGLITGITTVTSNYGTPLNQAIVKEVYNNSGVTIPKGKVVYVTGSQGTRLTVAMADASTEFTSSTAIAVTMQSISNNQSGYAINVGIISGLDTNHLTEGLQIWLSETAGEMTSTRPTQPAHGVLCGYCIKQGPGSSGILYIKIINYIELDELHNVLITGVQNNQLLNYNQATDVWVNTSNVSLGIITGTSFQGPGTFITSLNASNLASGTVPSARVSGTYSGITSVGSLTQLNVNGFTTSLGFFGPGTNLTNLNAANLSGTVPSVSISGFYSGITSVGVLSGLTVSGIGSIQILNVNPDVSQVRTYADGSIMFRQHTVFEAFQTLGISSDGADTGGYTDISTLVNTGVTTLLTTAPNSRLYLGWQDHLPRELRTLTSGGNAGVGGTCQWQRWSGSAWVNITGNNLTADGGSVTIPTTGTTKTDINGVNAYWIRSTAVSTYTTPPRMRINRNSVASNLPANANPAMYINGIFIAPSATNQATMDAVVASGSGAQAMFSGITYGNGEQNIMQIFSSQGGGQVFAITGDGSISAGSADNTFRNLTLNGGASNQNSVLTLVNSTKSQAAWGNSGVLFRSQAATRTNSSVAGTYPNAVFHSFGITTLAASNAGTITTDAANVYIENAVQQGTNQTITNRWALWVDAGDSRFDDNISVGGIATANAFVGNGANLSNLNASNLTSGSIPAARISGEFTGITSVGTLTQLNVSGFTTSLGFIGDGANLTNLNATNLTSGTVPSARVSGTYSGVTSVGALTQVTLAGGFYDSTNNIGLANSVLTSTGSATQWAKPTQQIIGYGLSVPSNSLGNDGDFYVVYV